MKQFSRPDEKPVCDSSNMIFFGTNMQDSGNRREHFGYLLDNGSKVVSSQAVASEPKAAARAALAHLQDEVNVIFVHLDVDFGCSLFAGLPISLILVAVRTFESGAICNFHPHTRHPPSTVRLSLREAAARTEAKYASYRKIFDDKQSRHPRQNRQISYKVLFTDQHRQVLLALAFAKEQGQGMEKKVVSLTDAPHHHRHITTSRCPT
jgi:hypothetical protein